MKKALSRVAVASFATLSLSSGTVQPKEDTHISKEHISSHSREQQEIQRVSLSLRDEAQKEFTESSEAAQNYCEEELTILEKQHPEYKEYITQLRNVASADTFHALAAQMPESQKGEENGNETLILIISLASFLYFARMMYRCARHEDPISFLQHHLVFAALLGTMWTQMPQEIVHGLVESSIAFGVIMAITRLSRGVINNVDMSTLSDEEAKAILYVYGPLLGIPFNSLTPSQVFYPLASRLKNNDSRYSAIQNVSNIDGSLGFGSFVGMVGVNKLGLTNGPLFQLGLMGPMFIFQKLYQAVLWKPNLKKHLPLLIEIFKGFRYDLERLGAKHGQEEEMKIIKECYTELRTKLNILTPEIKEDLEELKTIIDQNEQERVQEIIKEQEEYSGLKQVVDTLSAYIQQDKNAQHAAGAVAQELITALRDGHLTQAEIAAITDAASLEDILRKTKNGKQTYKNWEEYVNHLFHKFCKNINASHGEAEVMRIFTAQAMAVPLLIPFVEVLLKKFPVLTPILTTAMTAFADNYAAAAVASGTSPTGFSLAMALSISILFGGGSIYGNMPNLVFLGKNGNLGDSVRAGVKYLTPTALALFIYISSGTYIHSIEFATGKKIDDLLKHKNTPPQISKINNAK